jgi:MFS family permease
MAPAIADDDLSRQVAPAEASAARSWADSTLASFAFPVYRIVWLGSVLAFLAFNISSTAQSLVAFDLTGNNRAVGVVMFGQGVAMLLLNPFGGAIADRFNKRLLILGAQGAIGLVILVIAILLATDQISIFWLAVGSFTTGLMFAILGPARMSLLSEIVSPARIGNAAALIQVGSNFGRVLAPVIAGLMISWAVLGATGTYFVIAGAFVVVILTMSQIPSGPPRGLRTTSVLDDVKIGLRYARGNRRLLQQLLGYYAMTALGFTYFVVMPGFVHNELGQGKAAVGLLYGVTAIGGFFGSIAVASLADSTRAPLYLKLSSLLTIAALIGLGFMRSYEGAVVFLLLLGLGIASYQTLNNAVALRLSDPAYFGRVAGLLQIAWALISIVSLPVGALADEIGEVTTLSLSGAVLLGVVLLLTLWERRIKPPASVPSGLLTP